MLELPPRHVKIRVASPTEIARAAVEHLAAAGRVAELASDWRYGKSIEIGRLWHPNDLLSKQLTTLAPGRALDLGCGTGRDAVFLAAHGWHVTAVDRLEDALSKGRELATRYIPTSQDMIDWQCADLAHYQPTVSYDLLTMFLLFDRGWIMRLAQCLTPGGTVMLECFTPIHREKFGRPSRLGGTLSQGELECLVPGFEVVSVDEDWRPNGNHTCRVVAVGRIDDPSTRLSFGEPG